MSQPINHRLGFPQWCNESRLSLFLRHLGANISFFPTPVPPKLLGNCWDQLSWQPYDHLQSLTWHPCHPWFCFGHLAFLKLSDSIYCLLLTQLPTVPHSNPPHTMNKHLYIFTLFTKHSLGQPHFTSVWLSLNTTTSIAAHRREAPPSLNPTHASLEWRDRTCF